ncbi:MAG: nuclear transport factor 2 family protein [Bradyrhizobium sp.]|nr:nuclear transport factor 2 family protein [Bradyrhizobium sp.]
MSAIDNRKLMQEIFAGLANRDGTLFTDRMADDCRWINIGSNKWSGSFDGKEAVLRDLLGPLRAKLVARSRTVAHRFFADGDYVIVEARGDNLTREGKPYNNEYCFVFRLSEGRITEVKEYSDTALIEAVLGDPGETVAAAAPQR